jgi:hypothetical protein
MTCKDRRQQQSPAMTYHDDVVRSSGWQIVEPARKIGLGAEVLGSRRGESEELFHVEELYAMVDCKTVSVRLV